MLHYIQISKRTTDTDSQNTHVHTLMTKKMIKKLYYYIHI